MATSRHIAYLVSEAFRLKTFVLASSNTPKLNKKNSTILSQMAALERKCHKGHKIE